MARALNEARHEELTWSEKRGKDLGADFAINAVAEMLARDNGNFERSPFIRDCVLGSAPPALGKAYGDA